MRALNATAEITVNYPSRASHSVAHLLVSWVLIIPLLFYAQGIWFQNDRMNDRFASDFGAIVSQSQTAQNTITTLVIFAIIFWFAAPWVSKILDTCRKNPVLIALPIWALASCLWSQLPFKSFQWAVCLLV